VPALRGIVAPRESVVKPDDPGVLQKPTRGGTLGRLQGLHEAA